MRPNIRGIAQRLRHLGRVYLGRDVYYRRDVSRRYDLLGNLGARFAICPDLLTSDSIVYSFGIGTDISFDLELIQRFGVDVHAFDPTPTSLSWLKTQSLPPKFHVHEYGIAERDGVIRFSPPKSPLHVSHTIVNREGLSQTVSAPVRRITTIMQDLGHRQVDLLKMDIEGAEYGVIGDLLAHSIAVKQMCVEFHHRWPEIGPSKTRDAIDGLRASGYRIFHASESGEEYSFLGPH